MRAAISSSLSSGFSLSGNRRPLPVAFVTGDLGEEEGRGAGNLCGGAASSSEMDSGFASSSLCVICIKCCYRQDFCPCSWYCKINIIETINTIVIIVNIVINYVLITNVLSRVLPL